ncbi:hypothetical protein AX17_006260 [Amanita inopinata Kibby_2008]|nr:hypothetical protein AX17_006260 [Amanita inopinata Kibby_2008]
MATVAKSLASCIFCKIIKGEIPSFKLIETKLSYSFLDVGPLSRGHALVIPKYHTEKMHELPDEYLSDVMPIAKKIALAQGLTDYNILQNNGRIAHQVVSHVHFHVIPKPEEGDSSGLVIGWPAQPINEEELKKFHEELLDKLNISEARWLTKKNRAGALLSLLGSGGPKAPIPRGTTNPMPSFESDSSSTTVVQTPVPQREQHISSLARRIHGWSWQAFPIGLGTGAVYVTLSGIKDHSSVLTNIETGFFFLTVVLFLLNTVTLSLQAALYPKQAWRLLQDPVKGLFVPLIVLSFATLIIGTINYGVPTGHIKLGFVYSLFWIYVTFAILTCFPMLMIWFNNPHDLSTFTPAYAFLIFPLMLIGVVAFNVLKVLPPEDHRSIGVMLTGYFFQGMLFSNIPHVNLIVDRVGLLHDFLLHLHISYAPYNDGHQANGAFVACGPPGFTALALINLGDRSRQILLHHDLVAPVAGEVWYAASVMVGMLLFGLAVFFFAFGALPYWFKLHKNLDEILGCWALTFPNVGWIACLRVFGDTFKIRGFIILHTIMAILMCITWAILFILTIVAFCKGRIFKSKKEDVIKDTLYPKDGSVV